MNCRTFRKSHMDFVDGLLAERHSAEMYAHVDECDKCARHDLAMRRGLLVVRNLPEIELRSDLMARLQARIHDSGDPVQSRGRGPLARIAIELGAAVAVAVGAMLMLHARKTESHPLVVQHAAAVAANTARSELPRPSERERIPADPELDAGMATSVSVLLSAPAAGETRTPGLIDAALHAPSLTP